jgi:hypothetical protein
MIRAFQNGERISSAVPLKDGAVLQVYPSKQRFETLESWKNTFETAFFENESVRERRDRMRNKKHFDLYISETKENETIMQKTVRQLYNQCGLADSVSKNGLTFRRCYLYAFFPMTGEMVPVFFNRVTGNVVFLGKVQNDTLTVGITFFLQKVMGDFITVRPFVQEKKSAQKTVLYRVQRYNYEEDIKNVNTLIAAGFHLRFYSHYFISESFVKYLGNTNEFAGLITDCIDEEIYYFDTNTKCSEENQMNIHEWIEKQRQNVIITGLFTKDHIPPQTLEIEGNKLELVDVGYPIGMDENDGVFYKRQKTGEIQQLEIAEATLNYIKKNVVSCSVAGCQKKVFSKVGEPCWIHSESKGESETQKSSVL